MNLRMREYKIISKFESQISLSKLSEKPKNEFT